MITEDYVSFETAKLLKEKGFDEACDKKYFGDDCSGPSYIRERWEDGGDVCPMSNSDLDDGSKYADISAPTLQMVIKWLREVHKIFIEPKMSKNTFLWGYRVSVSNGSTVCLHANTFNKCEQACEAAIKYCLENLI